MAESEREVMESPVSDSTGLAVDVSTENATASAIKLIFVQGLVPASVSENYVGASS